MNEKNLTTEQKIKHIEWYIEGNPLDILFKDCIHDLIAENERYRKALEDITNQDYRGNRCNCQIIAQQIIQGDKE